MAAKKAKNRATTQELYHNIKNPFLSPITKSKLSFQMTTIDFTLIQLFLHLPSHFINEDNNIVVFNNKVVNF